MLDKIIDGKSISQFIKSEIKQRVGDIVNTGGAVKLAVVVVEGDISSKIYANSNKKACDKIGIETEIIELLNNTEQVELLSLIDDLNERKDINGIIVQMPLPNHIDEDEVFKRIKSEKDVEGVNPYNIGMLSIGKATFAPCTAQGVIELIKRSNIEIEGKNCVVIGRSNIVGKPISMLLLNESGTVTTCHSKTLNLREVCRSADILVASVGKAKFVTSDMVKDGAIIVDVGIHRLEDNSLCGDVDFDSCIEKASLITPVPGGVGAMTVAMLMRNSVKAYEQQKF